MQIDRQIEAVQNAKKHSRRLGNNKNTIGWIERLLDTPLDDFRKYSIKFILTPYLMNIRRLPRLDVFHMLSNQSN